MNSFLRSTLAVVASFCILSQSNSQESSHRIRVDRKQDTRRQMMDKLGENGVAKDWSVLGDAQLRAGKFNEAIRSFEKSIQLDPPSKPYLWQYGIALFFGDRFDDGKRLFEKHRKVNSNDVENAAWHFLCVAKATDIGQARQIVLPAPDDPRAPMDEILKRLRSTDDSEILGRMEELQSDSAQFYGNLYLGLIADAEGRDEDAIAFMKRAAQTKATHYMADVARVYLDHLVSSK